MLNERSDGAAQQGEGGDLPHQTLTPVSLARSLALLATKTEGIQQEEQDFFILILLFLQIDISIKGENLPQS